MESTLQHDFYVDSGLFEPANFCSGRTVSFHYVEYAKTRALFEIRKQLLSNSAISYEEKKELVKQLWSDNNKKGWVGGYGGILPKDRDTESWTSLFSVLRKISYPSSKCDSSYVT